MIFFSDGKDHAAIVQELCRDQHPEESVEMKSSIKQAIIRLLQMLSRCFPAHKF